MARDNSKKFGYGCKDVLNLSVESDNEKIRVGSTATSNTPPLTTLSSFDVLLTSLWDKAMNNGLFKYKLTKNCLPLKLLPGKFNYIAQLNPDRAEKRRQPQKIQSVNQSFNPEEFHFNKIDSQEILIHLEPQWCSKASNEHLLIINVSPLEYCHVLLTPFRNQCRPQKLTPEGLRLALELILLSNSCDLRVGFNSLCGYASVNHEHYHAYYLSHRLYIEHAELIKVPDMNDRCPWLQLKNPAYPPGLCIVLTDASEVSIISISDAVMMLSTYFQTNDVGHNVYITRGSSKNIKGHFDSIRIWIWARQSSFGTKECDAFNPALCELAGHFPIKNVESFAQIHEEFILTELHEICDGPFKKLRDWLISEFK